MINKKIKRALLIPMFAVTIGAGGSFQSCNFLDIDPYITDLFTLDTVFQKKEYTEGYLRNVYSYLIDYGSGIAWAGNVMPYTPISDECLAGYKKSNHYYNYFANNQIASDELYTVADRWTSFYEGIRKANTFIMRVNECQEVSAVQRNEWIGEARFVKASLYWELMMAFGPVVIMPEEPIDFDIPIDQMRLPRNTWDECSDYLLSQLELALAALPDKYPDTGDLGKPTKSSALAVMSRVSLATASPAFNGQTDFPGWKNKGGQTYFNTDYKEDKYAKAAAVAQRLINLDPADPRIYTAPLKEGVTGTPKLPVPDADRGDFPNGVGGIDPYHSFADMFNGTILASRNSEILFVRASTDMNSYGRYLAPGALEGWGVFSIPQGLVDAFYMNDGSSVDNTDYPQSDFTKTDSTFSGAKDGDGVFLAAGTHNWYTNREARFYATVGFCGSYWPSISSPESNVNARDGRFAKYYLDGQSGKNHALDVSGGEAEEYPMTGYLCKKFYHPEDSYVNGGRQKVKYAIVYRMAEVYLNYVEAMNELTKSYEVDGVTVSRNPTEMKRCFNLIRYRAGLPGITDADVANVQRMRNLIERERRIELAWEFRRYFDCRRNKTADKYENEPVIGCDVTKKEVERNQFFQKVRVREREWTYKVFTPRQTFFPIPRAEVDRNQNLDQLPGY